MEQKKIQIPVKEFNDNIHRWQLDTLRKFDDKEARFFLLNWHRRARKTTLLLNILIKEWVRNPKRVYGYIGPSYKQAKAIIWRDPNMLNRYLPPETYLRKNESELYIESRDKAILQIKGADDPDSLRGIDWAGLAIDEWALMKKEIWEEILRPVIAQHKDRWAIFAFTPKGRNHAFDYWEKSAEWEEWHRSFLPASRSGILTREELEKARREMPRSMYEQEFECSFLAVDEQTLISAEQLEDLKYINRAEPILKKVIACDPSQGTDECVIYVLENTRIAYERFLHYRDPMKIAGELMVISAQHKINDIAVDSIGIGSGIVGRLRELGKNVIEINSAERENTEQYNLRADMWWHLNNRIMNQDLAYPADLELRRQLTSVKYKVISSNGKIQLEPKIETKTRLGRSPDRADAFVYGVWALKSVSDYKSNKERRDWLGEYKDASKQELSHMSA